MKRIGIVTNYDEYNFGNRLQNYAAQTVLERMGMQVKTIVPAKRFYTSKKKRLLFLANRLVCSVCSSLLVKKKPNAVRRYRSDRFNRNIHFHLVPCENNQLPTSLADQYDAFVAGSDQVWNPYFWKFSLGSDEAGFNNYLLLFARAEQRKCFSPSIGMNELPKQWEKPFTEAWNTYRDIAVRENEGADLVRKMTGRNDVQVTVDPTLMLDAKDWELVMRKHPSRPSQKYVLYMLLGEESEEIPSEKREYLRELLAQKGMTRVSLFVIQKPNFYASSAGEFLDLISHAELVVTDSFHGTVFSFLFGKPFLLFKRNLSKYGIDMSSRTNTLLNLLALTHKKTENQRWEETQIWDCDYTQGWANLREAREKTRIFLEKSLEI